MAAGGDDKKLDKVLQQVSAMSVAATKKPHAFWDTQPVPTEDEITDPNINEPIIPTYEEIRQEPYNLPEGFAWCECDIEDPVVMDEIYKLLYENYVEDADAMFRFDYSREFLKWAIKPPGWLLVWHAGVRTTRTNKLVGFITAIPGDISVRGRVTKMVEINFLCVHKKLRKHRLAPVLIKEITRRVHCQGIFQAVYTAGVVLPRPMGRCRYYHRSLDPKKLVEIGFSHLPQRMTMKQLIKLNALPEAVTIRGFRPLEARDVPRVCELLNTFLAKTHLYQVYTEDEVAHWLLPKAGIVNCFVVENERGVVTDFCSYYLLPSTVINNPKHNTLNAAYSYHNVATSMELKTLMEAALVMAKKENVDVFNALDVMDNSTFLTDLRFGPGDGNLQYYIYNWRCAPTDAAHIGLVLL